MYSAHYQNYNYLLGTKLISKPLDPCLENKSVAFSCLSAGKWSIAPKLTIKCAAPPTTQTQKTTTTTKTTTRWTTRKTTVSTTTKTFKAVVTRKFWL